ncbi:hypothetical protein [Gudongella sp. DL1XJH-153]|uniref:hypothetical protein n=1 Tax=Gudongella sp. DL1XJH-153 TaxID=3409804 RepID=UPI003BB7C029
MKKRLLISLTLIAVFFAVIVYMNQSLFSMGINYIKYRYFGNEREASEYQEIEVNPFEKYLDMEIDDIEKTTTPTGENIKSEAGNEDTESQNINNMSEQNVSTESGPNSEISTTTTEPSGNQSPTVAQISREYMQEFEDMEVQFRGNLESLVDSAINDYNSGGYNKLDIADIYLQRGELMEVESDRKFYRLLSNLENKLIENSHNTKMVNEVESYYNKLKEYEKNRIIDKGMTLLEN